MIEKPLTIYYEKIRRGLHAPELSFARVHARLLLTASPVDPRLVNRVVQVPVGRPQVALQCRSQCQIEAFAGSRPVRAHRPIEGFSNLLSVWSY
jgi:hypothetical protein